VESTYATDGEEIIMCGGMGIGRSGELRVICNGECVRTSKNVDIRFIAPVLIDLQAQFNTPVFGVFTEQVGGKTIQQRATLAGSNNGINWGPYKE
jgi:hypothetical protein